jgi:DNA-binding CsgD family transcriptional regulator
MRRKTDDETILKMLEDGHTQKEIAEHFGVSPAAICKRVARLSAYPKTLKELSPKEQRFAVSVAEGKSQTQSAIEAYDVSSMGSAKSLGSQLMKKPRVNAAISELMEYHGMGRSYRVQKLKEHLDSPDPVISLKSLEISYKADGTFREILVPVPINFEALVEQTQSLEEASRAAQERKANALKQIAILEAQDKSKGEKP